MFCVVHPFFKIVFTLQLVFLLHRYAISTFPFNHLEVAEHWPSLLQQRQSH
jgi:hypothetical protein